MSESRSLPVPDGLAGERVDVAIAKLLGFSRSFAAEVVADQGVRVDGAVAAKSDRLQAESWLEIVWTPRAAPQIVPMAVPGMTIVHDDEDIVVVDKPVGVAAHPSPGWDGPTVPGGLAAAGFTIATTGAAERAGIVHRLDAGTSGLMVVAKTELAYTALKRAFKDRSVSKVYHAIAQGHPDPTFGTIDAPIGRHPSNDWKFAVTAGGKPSITHYATVEAFRAATLLEVHLETGRTHQIRVHMAAMRHPLVGDTMYGADPVLAESLGLTRQWLDAVRLGFQHPRTGTWVEFTAEYPADLRLALDTLRAA